MHSKLREVEFDAGRHHRAKPVFTLMSTDSPSASRGSTLASADADEDGILFL